MFKSRRLSLLVCGLAVTLSVCLLSPASAQVTTGSISGVVTDTSGGVLPGVTVSISGQRLIGGLKIATTDAAGRYGFDRLPPGAYDLKFEHAGFRASEQKGVALSAAFKATVNVKLEVGQMSETVEIMGEPPAVDVKGNVQQTVMNQELLEGVPTGRDPWSVAKIIPGVQVGTYDVGGTQGMQQSAVTSHGSQDSDKIFAIDGMNVNWPGGGGGSTMVYYDQGMFEEVNYQTSSIPAEVAVGGVFMNMVTKEGGNKLRGDAKFYWANDSTQAENHKTPELEKFGFAGGNPVTKQYDFNLNLGGPVIRDKLWFFGSYRNWKVDKQTLGARNPDGTFAIDDNKITNYSTKLTWAATQKHKITGSWNYNWKERFHRRDTPPNFVEDKASYIQQQPGYSVASKYTGVIGSTSVVESGLSYMSGTFPLQYQREVKPTDIRIEDSVLSTATGAAQRNYENPNSRFQFDNSLSLTRSTGRGVHALKVGVQYARQFFQENNRVNGDMHILFSDGVPNAVRIYNSPTSATSRVSQLGFFAQDGWTRGRLTINLGGRFDIAKGYIPEQSVPAGTFIGPRNLSKQDVFDQKLAVWRGGFVYDVSGNGKTAVKGNFSRYGNNVGINRVTLVHPFTLSNGTRSWTDRNGDRIPQESELGAFSGFAGVANRYADANGPNWPYSNEITLGIERQVYKDVRIGVMGYRRSNRGVIGFRNARVPSSAYSPVTLTLPSGAQGPGGTATVYNLSPAFFGAAFNDLVYDNQPLLDTDFTGVDFTLSKRFSRRWQAVAGLTLGKNNGGVDFGGDLNDPNNTTNQQGIVGNDSKYSFKLAGGYMIPRAEVMLSGTFLWNNGYPYQSTTSVTRTNISTLTRSSQTIRLTERGTERLQDVKLLDLRLSKSIRMGRGLKLQPQIEVFNVLNASTIVNIVATTGSRYLFPTEILAPRIFRFGASLNF